jgi:hypothetical protein
MLACDGDALAAEGDAPANEAGAGETVAVSKAAGLGKGDVARARNESLVGRGGLVELELHGMGREPTGLGGHGLQQHVTTPVTALALRGGRPVAGHGIEQCEQQYVVAGLAR